MKLWLRLLLLLILPLAARADDSRWSDIRTGLQRIRAEGPHHTETRGASPELTGVKHQLRDWIESHLARLPSDGNDSQSGKETALAAELNTEIKRARLLCSAEEECAKNDQTALGFLGQISLEFRQRESFLVVQTAVGVDCGFDESAYLYRWSQGAWKRIWQSEQNLYTKDDYAVQTLHAVMVSPSLKEGTPLVLTLGSAPWCSSNWRAVYYRLWRTYPDGAEPKLLLDRTEPAYLGGHDIPIQGSVGRDDVLIEFTIGSMDSDLHSRQAVRHYSVQGDQVQRVAPIALSPRDFTEEWITNSWEQSKLWSQSSSLVVLQHEHDQALSDVSNGEFERTRHCRTSPDLWQIGLNLSEKNKGMVYFLVRWQPPYRFTMVRVQHQPSPSCTEDDRADEYRTLFPIQDWRE